MCVTWHTLGVKRDSFKSMIRIWLIWSGKRLFLAYYQAVCSLRVHLYDRTHNMSDMSHRKKHGRSGTKKLMSPRPQLAPFPPHRRLHRLQATPVVRCAESRCWCSAGAAVGVKSRHHDSSPKGHIHESGLRSSSRVSRPSSAVWTCCQSTLLQTSHPKFVPDRADSSSEDNKLSTQARNDSSVVSWVSLHPIPSIKPWVSANTYKPHTYLCM